MKAYDQIGGRSRAIMMSNHYIDGHPLQSADEVIAEYEAKIGKQLSESDRKAFTRGWELGGARWYLNQLDTELNVMSYKEFKRLEQKLEAIYKECAISN